METLELSFHPAKLHAKAKGFRPLGALQPGNDVKRGEKAVPNWERDIIQVPVLSLETITKICYT